MFRIKFIEVTKITVLCLVGKPAFRKLMWLDMSFIKWCGYRESLRRKFSSWSHLRLT